MPLAFPKLSNAGVSTAFGTLLEFVQTVEPAILNTTVDEAEVSICSLLQVFVAAVIPESLSVETPPDIVLQCQFGVLPVPAASK